jgi:hypothetical protein
MNSCRPECRSMGCRVGTLSAILVAFTLVACSGADDHASTSQVQPNSLGNYGIPIAGCEQYSYTGCEITEPSCQQSVFELVKCVRKTPNGTLPPVTTITAAEYKNQLTQSSSNSNPTEIQKQENSLVMVGLASSGELTVSSQVDVLVNTVGAYYTSDEKKVYIIRPETAPTNTELQQQALTLAHEFVHALQDQDYDLTQYGKDNDKTYDSTLAASSIIEGEADYYATQLRAAFDGLTPGQVDYAARCANAVAYLEKTFASDSPVLIAPRVFPYFYGGPYVALELQAEGRSGVDSLFASPPPASLPFIVSQGSLVDTQLNPVTDAGPTPVAGSALFYEDTLGAWLTYEYLKPISGGTLAPLLSVSGWLGDHVWVYSDADTTVTSNIAVVWRVRFAAQFDVSNFINRTNLATVPFLNGTAVSRRAFALNGDAVVVAVTGTFDRVMWENAVTAAATAAAPSPSPTGASNAAAASTSLARLLLTKVPRVNR